VRLLGYVPTGDLEQYMATVDICLNLRYPTVGETSGTLQRALGLGRAVIVSDVGAFAELPGDICLKAPVGEGEVDALFEYLNLLTTHPEAGREMGARARHYAASECSWKRVGELYADWIRAVVEGQADRARDAATSATGWSAASDRNTTATAQRGEAGEPAAVAVAEGETTFKVLAGAGADTSTATQPTDAAAYSLTPIERVALAEYIRGFCFHNAGDAVYVENHITRLVHTLEITPRGGADDRLLEMGAYLQITPALKTKLGYGEVRGSYLGEAGTVEQRVAVSQSGERFECRIDHFDAEKDRYPYTDGFFSTVLCCELLEHLYEDPMHMMAEINRILKDGGHLVLSTPNICSLRAIGAVLLGYHPGLFHQYVQPDKSGAVDPRHAREYAPRDVHALLEAAGFEIVRLESGPYLDKPSLEHEWVKHLLQRYELPGHLRGDAIYAVGRKTSDVKSRFPPELYTGAVE
jgi:SAM-dependent methyltransferase